MSLELVNTFGTLLTVAIIAATAIAAMVQLRHLRAGNEINAMITIGNQIDAKEFREAQVLIQRELLRMMEDPAFRDYIVAIARQRPLPAVPETFNAVNIAAVLVCNTFEEVGILVKNDIVEKDIFLDRYFLAIARTWKQLAQFIAWARAAVGDDALWENFEYLAVLSEDWQRTRPSSYPKGVRRLQVHIPWTVPPMPATA